MAINPPFLCNRLFEAMQDHDDDEVARLIAGANLDEYDGRRTPFKMALMIDEMPYIRLLAEAKANLHALDKDSQTPLQFAAEQLCVNSVIYLTDCGVDVNHTDNESDTPLTKALTRPVSGYASALDMENCESIVSCLLFANATLTINHKNNKDKTALWMAVHTKLAHDVVRLLVKNGADVDKQIIKEAEDFAQERAEKDGPLVNMMQGFFQREGITMDADIHAKNLSLTPDILKKAMTPGSELNRQNLLAKDINKLMKVLLTEVTS